MKTNILAIIPARGGSKGIPGKNIKLLAGKPLIAYSIEAAKNSRFVNRVVVSTDYKDIAEVAEKYGAEVIMRPKELAEDKTPMDPVLKHVVEFLENEEGYTPDAVVLLQPTSPLRTAKHLDEAIEKFLEGDFDTIISVEVNKNPRHEIREGKYLVPSFKKIENRDKREPSYIENGAIYISKTDLIKNGKIRGERIGHHEMDRYSSIDIDEPIDFEIVERLLGNRQIKK
ncbi:MAG: acylneuraminate cytidylyltransferase family protein [Parcubacteria group bacterium]|nr:acylneuraminate cytidylyltransferase family protein [Parcubacteria group bacterium]